MYRDIIQKKIFLSGTLPLPILYVHSKKWLAATGSQEKDVS